MTISYDDQIANRRMLMSRLVTTIGDDDVYAHTFNPDSVAFRDILATSWAHMRINRYPTTAKGPNERCCRLTEIGWSRSIEETGGLEDPELTRRCGVLAATFKGYVEANQYADDQNVELEQVAMDSGLPRGWLVNAITGQLLTLKFNTLCATGKFLG